MLAYIITQVVQTKERCVPLTDHFSGFLKENGYTGNHRGAGIKSKWVQDQLVRLLKSKVSFENKVGDDEQEAMLSGRADVASRFVLWWDYKNPDQRALFESHIDLSEDFYQAFLANPVPLHTEVLAALKKSSWRSTYTCGCPTVCSPCRLPIRSQ